MMKVRLKKDKQTKIGIFLLTILLILSLVGFLLQNNHFEMILLTAELIFIFVFAKISYFTIISFIFWFSFLQEYFASISRVLSAGRLAWVTSVPIYHSELFICTSALFLMELFFFLTTNVVKNEKEMYRRKINITEKTALLYAIIAFILILLAYPTAPSFGAELARDEGFLPSSLIVPVAVLMIAMTYDCLKGNMFIKIIDTLSLFWILFHGDRVIVLGFFVYFVLRYMNGGKKKMDTLKSTLFNKKTLLILIVVFVLAAVFIRIQVTRDGNVFNMTKSEWLLNIVKQGTAGDVVYAFNCSVDMWKNGHGLNGASYLYYLSNILPSANQSLNPAHILSLRYDTLGGGLYFVEPMINGGLILTQLQTAVFLLLLVWVFAKKNKYGAFMAIPFVILIFRFAWYASFAGLVKMLLYYVPVLYFVAKKIRLR